MPPFNVSITPDLVQAVRDTVDIVDIAGGGTQVQRRGKRYIGLCPFHKEKTPSFSVDPDEGLFYCFGCGTGGDAIKLHMELTGDDFSDAIVDLAERYGIPLPKANIGRRPSPAQLGAAEALEEAAKFFRRQLTGSEAARAYLRRRDLSPELTERFGLGYAPDDWRTLVHSVGRQVPMPALEAAGLVARSEKRPDEPYDRFRNRLIFPISGPSGKLVGFGGRTLGDDKAKYINTAETEQFHKGSLVYGFHLAKKAIRDTNKALLVEGYTDVMAAAAVGIEWAVAGMGTALTAAQAKLLARYADEVIVAYDGDAAGEKAFRRALPILLGHGLAVRRARFPAGHDPDSLRMAEGPEAVVDCVENAEDGVWLEILTLIPEDKSPAAKTRAANAIAELLRPIRDRITRYDYGRRAAEHLGVPQDLLFSRVRPMRPLEDPEANTAPARDVRTEEERAITLLLLGAADLPSAESLPEEKIFFDEDCRNIYAAFCALYSSREGDPPKVGEILARLKDGGSAVDRTARLLLEESDPEEVGLIETLERLQHRWMKNHLPELLRQIKQAQAEGNHPRLAQLLEEKKALSLRLHPNMTGKFI